MISRMYTVKFHMEDKEPIEIQIKTWSRARAVKYAIDEVLWVGLEKLKKIEVKESK